MQSEYGTNKNNKSSIENVRDLLQQTNALIDHIISHDNELVKLSLTELDELLQTQYTLNKPKWDEHKKNTQQVKERYLSLLDEKGQLCAIMHWDDVDTWITKVDINAHKSFLINLINNVENIPDDYQSKCALVADFDNVWDFIKTNKLVLSPTDIHALDARFIKYVMSRSWYASSSPGINIESIKKDDENKSFRMSPSERFWVNVLASGRQDLDTDQVLCCIGVDANPLMRCMPQRLTVFQDGDLLPQIVEHYDKAHISPVIRCRRNLGILLDNTTTNFHEFSKLMDTAPFMTREFAIEFPYMCYVYVDRVEVDVEDFQYMNKEPMKNEAYLTVGSDYLMKSFKSVENKKRDMFSSDKIKTIVKTCNNGDTPSYYARVTFGMIGSFQTVDAIRLYGKAICLI